MTFHKWALIPSIVVLLSLTACIDGIGTEGDDDDDDDYSRVEVYIPVAQYTPVTGRLLASQCAQCHGTNGYSVNSWDRLVGSDDIAREMYEYSTAHIMGAQTIGYTPSEISEVSYYFLTQ
ncbi:MAG: hypothetical protein L3J38_06955 [Thiomicrorhabdus sp.]|nr:hypothetical protein [Thiomicrorhabdus sp.]MCF6299112.1 hypothetical protein [Thiomicrorhabdus sp.]